MTGLEGGSRVRIAVRGELRSVGLSAVAVVLLLVAAGCGRVEVDTPTSTPTAAAQATPTSEVRPLPPETPTQPPISTATVDPRRNQP
jgi:hypothetical protein